MAVLSHPASEAAQNCVVEGAPPARLLCVGGGGVVEALAIRWHGDFSLGSHAGFVIVEAGIGCEGGPRRA
jgi:hypothetical protein